MFAITNLDDAPVSKMVRSARRDEFMCEVAAGRDLSKLTDQQLGDFLKYIEEVHGYMPRNAKYMSDMRFRVEGADIAHSRAMSEHMARAEAASERRRSRR